MTFVLFSRQLAASPMSHPFVMGFLKDVKSIVILSKYSTSYSMSSQCWMIWWCVLDPKSNSSTPGARSCCSSWNCLYKAVTSHSSLVTRGGQGCYSPGEELCRLPIQQQGSAQPSKTSTTASLWYSNKILDKDEAWRHWSHQHYSSIVALCPCACGPHSRVS